MAILASICFAVTVPALIHVLGSLIHLTGHVLSVLRHVLCCG